MNRVSNLGRIQEAPYAHNRLRNRNIAATFAQ